MIIHRDGELNKETRVLIDHIQLNYGSNEYKYRGVWGWSVVQGGRWSKINEKEVPQIVKDTVRKMNLGLII
jgi:hypothetical protein